MKGHSLRIQLGSVFLGFLLLVVSSVAVTFWLVQTQQNDAAIINLAGRQRMLLQQMTRLTLTDPDNPKLEETIAAFQQTLTALSEGGTVLAGNGRSLSLPPAIHSETTALLDEISTLWSGFQNQLTTPEDNARLQTDSETLLVRLDTAVSSYERQAQAKINRLRWVQFIFLAAAFLLLAWGYTIVRRQFIQPLAALDNAAQGFGNGSLAVPIPALPDNEMGRLGKTLETMRGQIATHRSSLEQQVAQRTQELTTAFEFSQEIVQELDSSQLLQSVANHTRELMQGEAVSVCVLDKDDRFLELVANSGAGSQFVGLRQSAARGIVQPVIREHKTIVAEGSCASCAFLYHFPGAACTTAPLQVRGRSLGAVCVIRLQRPFSNDETRALTLLANAAAVALENTRLIEASQQQAKENASLAERERLAATLHDNLAQNLGAMHLSVDLLAKDLAAGEDEVAGQRVVELQGNLQQAYAQVRLALTGLREPEPDNDEFLTAVQTALADFKTRTGIPVEFIMDDKVVIELTAVAQKQALHIIREALTNTRRHAQAACVQLTIRQDQETIIIDIVDDGVGFDPTQVNNRNHLGLAIMRTRAERCQGQLTVHASPAQGTHISASFPIRATETPELEIE